MQLSDANTIDYLGIDKESGAIVATLIDDCDWSDEHAHLALLQAKINRYLDFIDSGEIYEQFLHATGRRAPREAPVRISILARCEPRGEGPRFLEQASTVAQELGAELSFKVLP